jgi:hypothetical protein
MTVSTRAQLLVATNQIRTETTYRANTALRVGSALDSIAESALLSTEPAALPTYTVATVPSAATYASMIIRLSDGFNGRPCLAMSDGTDWWVISQQLGKVASSVPVTTIATGAVTVTNALDIAVDTEASAASDDLDTINGTVNGQVVILRAVSSARTVVVKDGTGNLKLAGDFSLDNNEDRIVLRSNGTNLFELSRSDNGA